MCRCCRLCWEDLYWQCIEDKFCFDQNIVNYDPDEDECYFKKYNDNQEQALRNENLDQESFKTPIYDQPTKKSSDYRIVQQQTSILAPEIMAAFVNSQIFNENYSNQKTSTPSTTVHKKHLSEGFKDSKEQKTFIRRSSDSSNNEDSVDKTVSLNEQNEYPPNNNSFSFLSNKKKLQLEAPYFSFRPASESNIFIISKPAIGRISTTPEVPSVSFSQLPKNYAETPSVTPYRESKSLYEIQTAGIKEEDFSMPRYYTKSHLAAKQLIFDTDSEAPKRIEKSKRLKNIRMQLPPLMIHNSGSILDRNKEMKKNTRN